LFNQSFEINHYKNEELIKDLKRAIEQLFMTISEKSHIRKVELVLILKNNKSEFI
jgi:hypothetical protein